MRSGTGFRMVLNRYDGLVFVPEALKGAVIEVDVSLFQKIQVLDVYTEAMVLS